MNFFERQAEVRSLSRRLVWLFVLAVLAVVLAVDAVLLTVLAGFNPGERDSYDLTLPDRAWLAAHPGLVFGCSLLVLGVIALASFYKTSLLSAGGGVVARGAGGERVKSDTQDPQQRRLLNVVEEIAIASGVPMPAVYVLPHETGINAFAAGLNPSNAAIAVTRGCLDLLNRNELQGVIAHEFSHVVNGDMRLNVRLMGLLFGLIVIAAIARLVLRVAPRGGGRKNGNALALIFLVAGVIYVLGYIGLFFGRMIQAAVARKRESLADASAVQFTRDPLGLRGALVKIGASATGSRFVDADADEVAHMLFAPGMARLFATHPPLLERIKAIDPRFDPREFEQARAQLASRQAVDESVEESVDAKPTAAERLQTVLTTAAGASAAGITQLVGQPTDAHIDLARAIRVSLPPAILEATHKTADASALLFALALDREPELRAQQLNFIQHQLGQAQAQGVQVWLDTVDQLNAMQRQPALLRLLPTLRQLTAAERSALLICLNGLLQRGGRVSLQQYALRKLAQVQLRDVEIAGNGQQQTALSAVANEAALLLAVLAHDGHDDPQMARQAYERGMQDLFARNRPEYRVPVDWSLQLDRALNRLDRLMPAGKEMLIAAIVRTISHDGKLTAGEAELLRATCASIHCPLPPLFAANDA